MIKSEVLLGLPNYEISWIELNGVEVRITARYVGPISCPHCDGSRLRSKDRSYAAGAA